MIGIKTKVTLERTLYLDLPDDASEEDILKEANKEVTLPTNALYTSSQALRNLHVNIPNLDLNDWNASDVNYEIIK